MHRSLSLLEAALTRFAFWRAIADRGAPAQLDSCVVAKLRLSLTGGAFFCARNWFIGQCVQCVNHVLKAQRVQVTHLAQYVLRV